MKCLGLGCSPRENGNTSILLEKALEGAKAAGAETELVYLRNLKFSPCIACGGCNTDGGCVLKDDMQQLYDKIINADRLILAAPIFSMGMNALGKAMVDRTQRFWATKYVLQHDVIPDKYSRPDRKGFFISVSGSHWKNVFAGAEQVARYFFRMCEIEYMPPLLFSDNDEKGAVLKHPEILEQIYVAGKELILDKKNK